MKRIAWGLLLLCLCVPLMAADKTAAVNGLWSVAGTWSPSGQPAATDQVIIPANFSVELDAGATCATGGANCAAADADDGALVIGAGASLTLGRGVTVTRLACDVGSNPVCVQNSGTFIQGPGQTVKMQGNNEANDIWRTASGGRTVRRGRLVTAGTISAVVTDEDTITDPDLGFGLSRRNFVFADRLGHFPMDTDGTGSWDNGAATCTDNCYVVRFTSGERAWRSYNLIGNTPTTITVDDTSRYNTACVTGGRTAATCTDAFGGTYSTGTACLAATAGGACAAAGAFVEGTGVTWTNAIGFGSRWYCNADGPGTAVRVKRVADSNTLELERSVTASGGNCDGAGADAYRLLDDNQPWPFADHSEHIAEGDGYEIFQPATFQGATTAGGEPTGAGLTEQSTEQVQLGGLLEVEYASYKWVGQSGAALSGIVIDRPLTGWRFRNNEIARWTSGAAMEIDRATGITLEGNFVHGVHPQMTVGQGHGIWLNDNGDPLTVGLNNRIARNRFDMTGDDAAWARAPSKSLRFTENICKYLSATLNSETNNCLDTFPWGAGPANPAGTWYHEDLIAADNTCMNIGGLESEAWANSCFGVIQRGGTGAGLSMVGISKNRMANMQTGQGVTYESQGAQGGTAADYTASLFTVSGNYISHTAYEGIVGVHNAFNNVIVAWGLNRNDQGRTLAAMTNISKRVSGNLTIPQDEALGAGVPQQKAALYFYATPPVPFIYPATIDISDNALFGHGLQILFGDWFVFGDLTGNPRPVIDHNLIDCSLSRATADGFGEEVGIRFLQTSAESATVTRNVIVGCEDKGVFRQNGGGGGITLTENNNAFLNMDVNVSGFTADGTDVTGAAPAWSPLSFNFDRRADLSGYDRGPRAIGAMLNPQWSLSVSPPLAGSSAANAIDSDGDGVADLFDNCKLVFNPSQYDADADGKGNACDASP